MDVCNWQLKCPECNKKVSMEAPTARDVGDTIHELRLRLHQHCCTKHSCQDGDPWELIEGLQPTLFTLDWSRKLRSPSPPGPEPASQQGRPSRRRSRSREALTPQPPRDPPPSLSEFRGIRQQLDRIEDVVERILRRLS